MDKQKSRKAFRKQIIEADNTGIDKATKEQLLDANRLLHGKIKWLSNNVLCGIDRMEVSDINNNNKMRFLRIISENTERIYAAAEFIESIGFKLKKFD